MPANGSDIERSRKKSVSIACIFGYKKKRTLSTNINLEQTNSKVMRFSVTYYYSNSTNNMKLRRTYQTKTIATTMTIHRGEQTKWKQNKNKRKNTEKITHEIHSARFRFFFFFFFVKKRRNYIIQNGFWLCVSPWWTFGSRRYTEDNRKKRIFFPNNFQKKKRLLTWICLKILIRLWCSKR